MLLLDTGPIIAAANTADPDHIACARLLTSQPGPFIVTGLVVSEACYLVGKHLGALTEAALLRSLATDRFRIEALTESDLRRMADLVEQYADLGLGGPTHRLSPWPSGSQSPPSPPSTTGTSPPTT